MIKTVQLLISLTKNKIIVIHKVNKMSDYFNSNNNNIKY